MESDDTVRSLLEYLDRSPSAFHAAFRAASLLEQAGFGVLDEAEPWRLEPGARYVFTRNMSTLVAIRIGLSPVREAGFRIITAHTDSPAMKIKPGTESVSAGTLRMTVEVYGGPIYHTWVDRELCVAGAVVVERDGRLQRRLFEERDPLGIIPSVAIHLNRDVNKGFPHNPQDHLKVVLSASVEDDDKSASSDGGFMRNYLSSKLDVAASEIVDFDLYLSDCSAAAVIGREGEMIVSGRLDNLAMCHAAVAAIERAGARAHTQIVVLFDGEEIGSRTFHGAASSLLRDVVERVVASATASVGGSCEDVHRALARSAMVSGDAAHAVHPSYEDKHDEHYRPRLNGGPVIKIDAGRRYTTTSYSAALFAAVCAEKDVRLQRIISRSDASPGSTVGPIVSTSLGIPAVDIGHPVWAMHSIRETGGAKDHPMVVSALTGFLESELSWR